LLRSLPGMDADMIATYPDYPDYPDYAYEPQRNRDFVRHALRGAHRTRCGMVAQDWPTAEPQPPENKKRAVVGLWDCFDCAAKEMPWTTS
jgi:hypothetical protein